MAGAGAGVGSCRLAIFAGLFGAALRSWVPLLYEIPVIAIPVAHEVEELPTPRPRTRQTKARSRKVAKPSPCVAPAPCQGWLEWAAQIGLAGSIGAVAGAVWVSCGACGWCLSRWNFGFGTQGEVAVGNPARVSLGDLPSLASQAASSLSSRGGSFHDSSGGSTAESSLRSPVEDVVEVWQPRRRNL